MNTFYDAVKKFWQRDYVADIEAMSNSAGFVHAPPSILTGDPFSAQAGNLMVLGINPKWQNGGTKFEAEINQLRSHHPLHFDEYQQWRATYFSGEDYYGRYFSRLGEALGRSIYFKEMLLARAAARKNWKAGRWLFDRFAAKFDLLPWWSSDVKGFDFVELSRTSPFKAWKELLLEFVNVYKPRAIVVNGSGQRDLVSHVFDTPFTRVAEHDGWLGRVHGTPILIHRQLNAPGGLGHDKYAAMVAASGLSGS